MPGAPGGGSNEGWEGRGAGCEEPDGGGAEFDPPEGLIDQSLKMMLVWSLDSRFIVAWKL